MRNSTSLDLEYYAVLKVKPGSSPEEIKRQYRRLAKIYHPDRNPGEEEWCAEQLKHVNDAYACLGDPVKKAEYDRQFTNTQGYNPRAGAGSPDGHRRPSQNASGVGGNRAESTATELKQSQSVSMDVKLKKSNSYFTVLGIIAAAVLAITAYELQMNATIVPAYRAPKITHHHAPTPPHVALSHTSNLRHYASEYYHPTHHHAARHTQLAVHKSHPITYESAPPQLTESDKAASAAADQMEKVRQGGE